MKSFLRTAAALGALLAATACATASQTATPAAAPAGASAVAVAQDPVPVAGLPAMWRVSDTDTTIYLFGTIHLLPKGDQEWFSGPVKEAFERSGELRMELASLEPTPAEAQAMMAQAVAPPGSPALSTRLNETQRTALGEVATLTGIPTQALDAMRPWFTGIMAAAAIATKVGLDPKEGGEMVLKGFATEAGKPVTGFESFGEQIGFFTSLPEEDALKMLTSTLDDWSASADLMRDMHAAWRSGDAAGLAALMNKGLEGQAGARKALLEDRNRRWADWIDTRMDQPGTVFVAVGAGHLGGHDSVQVFLQQHGHRAVQLTGSR